MLIEVLIVAAIVVTALSLITEHVSPKVAGIIYGAPTGTAITLFFLGLNSGAQFAAHSAIYNMIGMIAMQSLLFAYYKASIHFKKNTVIFSSICAVTVYLFVISILKSLQLDSITAIILPLSSVAVFGFLFREIENVKITNPVKLNIKTVILRALCAAIIITSIVNASGFLGPTWSGLFSSFPTTLFPLILIISTTYGVQPVHSIIKNVPLGLPSLILFSLTVSLTYPIYGVYVGIAISLAAALTYLITLKVIIEKLKHYEQKN